MSIHTFTPNLYHYTFGPHAPALRVDDGGRIEFICPDADNTFADGSTIPPQRRDLGDPPSPIEGNPMVGPVVLNGLQAGDTLAVTLEEIAVDAAHGRTLLAPRHGYLSHDDLGDTPPRKMLRWRLDADAGLAELVDPRGGDAVRVPLRPMVGCLGVAPAGASVNTLDAGAHGGNLDLPGVRAGATVLLPVFHDGGLFMLGDLHAAQGHGEIIGGGIETSGRVVATLRRVSGWPLRGPVVISGDHLAAAHTADTADAAIRGAFAALLAVLVEALGLERWDAYAWMSQTARIELGGFGRTCTASAGVDLDGLPPRCAAWPASFREGEAAS